MAKTYIGRKDIYTNLFLNVFFFVYRNIFF